MKTPDAVRGFWNDLLDLVYPVRCAVCDRIGEGYLCPVCLGEMTPVPEPYCRRCHEPMSEPLCEPCRRTPPAFIMARSAGLFEGRLRLAVHALKYGRRRRAAVPLAGLLERAWRDEPGLRSAERIVVLAADPQRERQRGYNPPELLAVEVARRIGIPFEPGALRRTAPRPAQVGLGREARRANVAGIFKAERTLAENARLLLIDDVLTTGATCDAASRALLHAGAREVRVLTLAREGFGPPRSEPALSLQET